MRVSEQQPITTSSCWLEIDDATLMALLRKHGQDINDLAEVERGGETEGLDDADLVPLAAGWLRLSAGRAGDLVAQWVSDPIDQDPVGAPIVFTDAEIEELHGWVAQGLDITPTLSWRLRILRDPRRESYAAAIYDRNDPEPKLVFAGVYPDAVLCESEPPTVAFVEPHPDVLGRARARLAPIAEDSFTSAARTLAEGPAGGVQLMPCSVRRFVKVGHGVRSDRIWQLFDATQSNPQAIATPEPVHEPSLIDVALLGDEPVLVQATGEDGQWHIEASELWDGRARRRWQVASGQGRIRQIVGSNGTALVRVSSDSDTHAEHLYLLPLTGPSPAPAKPLLSSPGVFNLNLNTCAAVVGFIVAELRTGVPPVKWFFDSTGRLLNPSASPAVDVHSARERFVSADGFEGDLDIRWRGNPTFCGPVVLMVYGAYGIDLDLDSDQDLRHWLDRGYAVATAHVRGGGDAHRHRAGSQGRRDRCLADTVAAVEWLRSGRGAVTATKLCVIGASAGGFLAASLLVEEPAMIDAAVIANGYIDPLTDLLYRQSPTKEADLDEWGDPAHNPHDREVLERLSPLRRLTAPVAPTLVTVSARDARVDPRQGLAWVLRSRELGGGVTLWYDPDGTHDMWGAQLHPNVLIDWVTKVLE